MTTATIATVGRTPRRRSSSNPRRRIVTNVVMIVILGFFALVLLWPGLLANVNPIYNGNDMLAAPSAQHWFGTDQLGRDIYSRVIFGAQPVLIASLGGVLLATVSGVTIGIIGGIAPRAISTLVMRIVDVLLALPVLLVALILIATIGAGVNSIVFALAVAYTPGFARVVEASVRKLRAIEYVQAASLFGSTGLRTTFRHLLPNLITEVVVVASSAVGWAALTATTLSFLGLGVQLPNPDWGGDLAAGATSLSTAWWLSTFPGLAITATILVANFAGDWVMGLIDPAGRKPNTRVRAFRGLKTSLPNASETKHGEPPTPATPELINTSKEKKWH